MDQNADSGAGTEGARANGVDDTAKQTRARRPKTVIGTVQPGTLPKAWTDLRNKNRLGVRVNFHKLDTEALKRYRKFYKLSDVGPDSTKEQLVVAVGKHFMTQQVDEAKAISLFLKTARQQNEK